MRAPPRGLTRWRRARRAAARRERRDGAGLQRARAPPEFHSRATPAQARAARRWCERRGAARVRRAAQRRARRAGGALLGAASQRAAPSVRGPGAPPRHTQPPGGAGSGAASAQRNGSAQRGGKGGALGLRGGERTCAHSAARCPAAMRADVAHRAPPPPSGDLVRALRTWCAPGSAQARLPSSRGAALGCRLARRPSA